MNIVRPLTFSSNFGPPSLDGQPDAISLLVLWDLTFRTVHLEEGLFGFAAVWPETHAEQHQTACRHGSCQKAHAHGKEKFSA